MNFIYIAELKHKVFVGSTGEGINFLVKIKFVKKYKNKMFYLEIITSNNSIMELRQNILDSNTRMHIEGLNFKLFNIKDIKSNIKRIICEMYK